MSKVTVNDPAAVGLTVKAAAAQTAHLFEVTDSAGVVLFYVDSAGNISAGGGDVVGPGSSTDNAIVRFNLATGKSMQNSVGILSDAGALSGVTVNANVVTSGSLDGDRLTAPSATKRGGVKEFGTPAGKFLRDDDSWATPAGGLGDVVGPASATDNAIVRYDTTSGKAVQNGIPTISDGGVITSTAGVKTDKILSGGAVGIRDLADAAFQGIDALEVYVDGVQTITSARAIVNATADAALIATGTLDPAVLPAMSAGAKGAVPATGAPSGKFLNDGGTFSIPAGSGGDVIGPTGATNNALARFDTATGKLIQDSAAIVSDGGALSGVTVDAGIITSGSIDGDRLAAPTTTKRGGVKATGAPAGKYYKDNDTWDTPAGGLGDVVGPASSTDNGLVRFDTTTGKAVQNTSSWFMDDSGNLRFASDGAVDIGDATNKLKHFYLSGGAAGQMRAAAAVQFRTTNGAAYQSADLLSLLIGGVAVIDSSGIIVPAALPAPAASLKGGIALPAGATGAFYRDDGTWVIPGGGSGPRGGADYVVWVDGATYYAQNGDTGAVDFSNADFKSLIAACMAAKAGVTIEMRAGTYALASAINPYGAGVTPSVDGVSLTIFAKNRGTVIIQASAPITTGMFDVRAFDVKLYGLTLDGDNQAGTIGLGMGSVPGDGYIAPDFVMKDCIIKNCAEAIQFRDYFQNVVIDTVRMMDGNLVGLNFYQDVGVVGDDGQLLVTNCAISGINGAIVKGSIHGTCHRILFNRCGIFDSHSGTYMADFSDMYELTCVSCDFETSASGKPSTAMIRVGGHSQVFIGCLMYGRNLAGLVGVVDNGTYPPDGVVFIGTNWDTWLAGSIAYNTTYAIQCIGDARKSFSGTLYYGNCQYWNTTEGLKTTWLQHSEVQFEEDWFGQALNAYVWRLSGTGGTATVTADVEGGQLLLASGATNTNVGQLDWNGKRQWSNAKSAIFDTKFQLTKKNQVDVSFGLYYDVDNYILLTMTSTSSDTHWTCRVKDGGTETATVLAGWSDLLVHTLTIQNSSGNVAFIFDGVTTNITTNIPAEKLEPRIKIETTEDVTADVKLNYINLRQWR